MILGLDIGGKRTGVAISSGLLAAEHSTITASGDELIRQLVELCQKENIEKIIAGLPVNDDGTFSEQTHFVTGIIERLKQATDLPVILEDEFLTTGEAHRLLEAMGISRELAEKRIDQYSAQLILQQYLDNL